jgi:hypothetical protein
MAEHAAHSYGLTAEQVEWISQGAYDEDHCATDIYPPAGFWCIPAIPNGFHSWDPDTGAFWTEPSWWPAFGSGLTRANQLFSKAVDAYHSGDPEAAHLWLGRAMHMLGDVSTPAHVHLDTHLPGDSDSYESWLGEDDHLNTRAWIDTNPPGSSWVTDFNDLPAWEDLSSDLQNQLESASQFYGERDSGESLWKLGPVGEDTVIYRLMYLLAEEADNWDSNDVGGEQYPGDTSNPAYLTQIRDTTFPILARNSTALISYFHALVLLPSAPELISPSEGQRTPDDPPTFTWAPLGVEAEYHIEIDESLDFAQPTLTATLTETGYTPATTLGGGDFYWRVRATTSAGTGNWSPVWGVTVVTEPTAPQLLNPGDGLELCDTRPAFSWSAVDQALEYGLEVDDNDSFISPEINLVQETTTYTPTAAFNPGAFFWRTNGRNEFFSGPWSPVWMVVVQDVPGKPNLVSPGNGALIGNWPPTLTWDAAEGASSYRLQVDETQDFLTPVVDQEGLAESSFTPVLLPTGAYYWRVAADGNCGAGEWSQPGNFAYGWVVSIPLVVRP